MFGIGGGEILVVALIALILFGNEDLPKNMRKIVKAWNDFRGVTNDLQRSWLDVRDQVTRDLLTDQTPHPHHQAPSGTEQAQSTPDNPPESSSISSSSDLQSEQKHSDLVDASHHAEATDQNADLTPRIQPAEGIVSQDKTHQSKEKVDQES